MCIKSDSLELQVEEFNFKLVSSSCILDNLIIIIIIYLFFCLGPDVYFQLPLGFQVYYFIFSDNFNLKHFEFGGIF